MLLVILCGNIVAETCCDYIVLLYCYREMLLVLLVGYIVTETYC